MGAPFPHPYRTAPDSLDAIRADLDAMLGRVDAFEAEPHAPGDAESVEVLARMGRELFLRRALEEAAEHAAAMLPSLGLPRLVCPDFVGVDPIAAGEALAAAIDALDAMDADPDLEPYLAGDPSPGRLLDVEAEDGLDEDDGSAEPSLASPERHPVVPWAGNHVRHYVTRDRHDTQARWADGSRQDTEGDIVDEPHDGEHEDLEHEPAEDSLGSAIGDGDQRHWSQGRQGEAEADPAEGSGVLRTVAQCEAARARRPGLHELARQAREIRSRTRASAAPFDPDTVVPIGPGMVAWGGPSFTRDGVPIVGTVSR